MAQAQLLPDNWYSGNVGLEPNYERSTMPIGPQVNPQEVLTAAQQSSGGYNKPKRTPSGDWGKDFLDIASGYSPSARNLESSVFPEFSQLYPGFQMNRNASGYVDALTAPNGQIFDTQQNSGLDRSDAWQWNLAGGPGFQAPMQSNYAAQFSDPLTAQYEKLLQGQTSLYQQQQQRMQEEAARQKQVQAQTDAAVQRLLEYMNQRVGKLQQPAYTGAEQEVLRTQALEPIERDRQAARKRVLENISSRNLASTGDFSGIAQQLLNDVDQSYNETRANAQNSLASSQIAEQRSRDQEVQQLLSSMTQIPQQAATGNLNFLQLLDSLVNQPGQQALATGALLSDLPVQRTQLGLQVAGMGGQPISSLPSVLQLLNNSQQNRFVNQQQTSDFWRQIGLSLGGL